MKQQSEEPIDTSASSEMEIGIESGVKELEEKPLVREHRELYVHSPINLDNQEMRFLTLHPGDKDSQLVCSMSQAPLAECDPYIAVVNTRGNPLANVGINVDGYSLTVTYNIMVFLLHIRKSDEPMRLWFRDVCINHRDEGEKARYWNPEWMNVMNQHAALILDLSESMAKLWDKGELVRPFHPRPKNYLGPTGKPVFTKHHPIPLGSWHGEHAPPLPHKYLPLDYVADEFRLVWLWRAENYSDPLRANFGYTAMHDVVTYHGISYNWGQEEATHEILLNGQSFLIRKNLDTFLRTARQHGDVVMWIDAICIDQNNVAERNRQLSRMFEIYEAATVVISWIGEADQSSNVALELLDDLKAPVLRMKDNDQWDVNRPEDFPRRLAALYRFLTRPYFRRVWVIQEIAASTKPVLMCGQKLVHWSEMDKAAYHLVDVLHSDLSMARQIKEADPALKSISDRDLSFARKIFYFRHLKVRGKDDPWGLAPPWGARIPNQVPGILDAVSLGRDFESTCPHDKIFALWNLAEDTNGMNFKLDYSKSISQTYIEFAVAVAMHNSSLDVICASETTSLDVPSWCPDWSQPSTASSMIRRDHITNRFMSTVDDIGGSIYHPCGKYKGNPRFSFNGRILETAGVILDTIEIIAPQDPDLATRSTWTEWLTIVAKHCSKPEDDSLPLTEHAYNSAFWSMLAGDVTGVWGVEERTGPPYSQEDDAERLWFRLKCFKEDECRYKHRYTSEDVHAIVTRGRKLVITKGGYMGLAPYWVERGQKLAILNKCTSPILLKEGEIKDEWKLVGSCFVQNWMEGEMLREYGETDEQAWEAIDALGRLRIS